MTTQELQDKFQTVVDQHKKILYKVCNSYCRNRDDRDDLAQEIIIQRMLHIRHLQWTLLLAPLLWTPLLIVALEGFLRVDAYKTLGPAYLLASLLLGLAIIPLAIWLSKKFGDGMDRSPKIQWLMKELAGYNLNAASDFLATLSEFEVEKRDNRRSEGR
jgi:predicted membrane metal-binding protein